jgi:predicted outer membrane protein
LAIWGDDKSCDDRNKTKPAEFARMAAVVNMFEIKSSEPALEAASKDSTKEFAQHMIADHTKAGEEIANPKRLSNIDSHGYLFV